MLSRTVRRGLFFIALLGAAWLGLASPRGAAAQSLTDAVDKTLPRMVKIFGAGGFKGLEAYQSGFLISAEGHVMTSWSYVLDSEVVTVVLHDGRVFSAELLGADPGLELAVIKIPAAELPYFDLGEATAAAAGTRVLALSNLFGIATGDEPSSVQRGVVAARVPLAARRGAWLTPYRGPALILDAMTNNPGAAGGALVDHRGRLLGMLGRELRDAGTGVWVNYAIPISELSAAVDGIRAGNYAPRRADEKVVRPARAVNLFELGVSLVPDVLERTPPFIDRVRPGSPAALAGLRADDLLLFVEDKLMPSCRALKKELELHAAEDALAVTVMREQELITVKIEPPADSANPERKGQTEPKGPSGQEERPR